MSHTNDPLEKSKPGILKPKELHYIRLRLEGKSSTKAEEIAGVSKACRQKIVKDGAIVKAFDDFVAAYAERVRALVPADQLAQLIHDGCYAMDPDGKPDWRARRFYIQMAAEHGKLIDTSKTSNLPSSRTQAPSLNINIVSVNDTNKDRFDPLNRQPVLRGSSKGGGRSSSGPNSPRREPPTIDAED
jgi:hypothetical protein